jgi:biofilm PGA synthesis lipoprotein PgaB
MRRLSLILLLVMPVHAAGLDYDVIAYHDVRDEITADDANTYSTSTEHLIAHFRWLHDAGFRPVSVEQILAAEAGRVPLPENAVLLTFDDGPSSVYTRVFPLLKLFDYPAVISVVTSWIETDGYLTWNQVREMQASGLVEIGSHTHDLHKGIPGNPQGNLQPATVTRRYDGGHYENETAYHDRIAKDLAQSVAMIVAETGQRPRVITWPYGAFNDTASGVAERLGMHLSLTLEPDNSHFGDLRHRGRLLLTNNPSLADLSAELQLEERAAIIRVAQVDLDFVYDPDPQQQEANLGRLLDRIKGLEISHVFLQAYADPDGDGAADAVYFPNRHLPVRADLFNRTAWQLKTRADVRVYAWLPMLSYVGGPFRQDWRIIRAKRDVNAALMPDDPRLSPFHADAVRHIAEVYEDLATYAKFDGLLFHDDGRLDEQEDFSPAALTVYEDEFGVIPTPELLLADSSLRLRFTELKTRSLIDLGTLLADRVRRRLPHIRTARSLFASALLDDAAPTYLAQDFDVFLESYDHVALMAMPALEHAEDSEAFFAALIAEVAERAAGIERTIFELQTIDWASASRIPGAEIRRTMRWLQSQGVRHLGYYPDDFVGGHPEFESLRLGISLADHFGEDSR